MLPLLARTISHGNEPQSPFQPCIRHGFCWSFTLLLVSTALSAGCTGPSLTVEDLQYWDGATRTTDQKRHHTAIEYPLIDNQTTETVTKSLEPRSVARRAEDEVRDLPLHEAIFIALSQNRVIENSALGGIGASRVLTSPQAVPSVYDSAIQETGVLFGRRGLEAALSDFDTRLGTSVNWGSGNTSSFETELQKSLASGGAISLFHRWNQPGFGQDDFIGQLGARLRQPLMAGAGTEFTRIAGPIRPGFGAIAGVSQGVVIARINQDITLADFELSVRNALRDIEYAYWDLYLAYRVYDATAASHRSAHQTWKELNTRVELGSGDLVETFQAEDRFFQTRAQLELSLNSLYTAETALRRLIGLPMNDGTVLRPSTEPERGELQPDWKTALNDGLSQRVELRRQKWQIRSLQLQLSAAKSLIRPQLDAVGSYAALGSGDSLISQSSSSMYGGMTGNSDDAWTLGLEMSLPVGLRQSRSQMRNYELQLAKNNAILSAQEQSIAHDIAQSMQDLSAAWAAANSNQNRIQAAEGRVQQLATRKSVGVLTSDLVLRAQASLADAEVAYYQQLINYNKSIAAFHLATGNLLPIYNVTLAEGDWDQQAIDGAFMRADARTHALEHPNLHSAPEVFATPKNPFNRQRVNHPQVSEAVDPPGQQDPATTVVPASPNSGAPSEIVTEPVK